MNRFGIECVHPAPKDISFDRGILIYPTREPTPLFTPLCIAITATNVLTLIVLLSLL